MELQQFILKNASFHSSQFKYSIQVSTSNEDNHHHQYLSVSIYCFVYNYLYNVSSSLAIISPAWFLINRINFFLQQVALMGEHAKTMEHAYTIMAKTTAYALMTTLDRIVQRNTFLAMKTLAWMVEYVRTFLGKTIQHLNASANLAFEENFAMNRMVRFCFPDYVFLKLAF